MNIEQHEKLLNDLIVQTRVAVRLNQRDKVPVVYSKFIAAYEQSPALLREKFKDVVRLMHNEVIK